MKSTPTLATQWSIGIVGLFCAAAVGAIVTILVQHPFAPESLHESQTAEDIRVVSQPFVDPRQVRIDISEGPDRELLSQSVGRVTAFNCVIGETVVSGSSPVSIDGVPRLALATTIPMWRDLWRGSRGADVDALHAELTRLGYSVAADGPLVGSQTITALKDALNAIGTNATHVNSIPYSLIIWIPDASADITHCSIPTGQQVAPGTLLASFAPSIAGARVTTIPDLLVPGERELSLGGITMPVDADGEIDDAGSLAALAASPEFAKSAEDPDHPGIQATYRLAKAVEMAVVPPSSVVGTSGTQCVFSDGKSIDVTVIGSQLGQSYVTFEGPTPSKVTIKPDASSRCK